MSAGCEDGSTEEGCGEGAGCEDGSTEEGCGGGAGCEDGSTDEGCTAEVPESPPATPESETPAFTG